MRDPKQSQLEYRKISGVLRERIPSFVRVDHPGFSAFLEAYFEWLESEYSDFRIGDLKYAKDVDKSFDHFTDYFRSEFLNSFPRDLAVNEVTGPLDQRKLIKNIKQFYANKGTEKTFNLLFRILFDVDVEIYLPKEDILRASDSSWQRQRSIRTTSNLGLNIFRATNRKIEQIDLETNTSKATARVERVILYREGDFEVSELFLNDILGEFEPGYPIRFQSNTTNTRFYYETHTYPVVTRIEVTSRGIGHIPGEYVSVSGGGGSGAYGVVNRIDENGGVIEVRIVNFGANYTDPDSIVVTFGRSQQEIDNSLPPPSGIALTGALCVHTGSFADDKGHLSSGKVLQDNRYYQDFSYVLKSEIVISRYRDTIKRLIHPAGFAMFGAILIKKCAEVDLSKSVSLLQFEVPLIGHYAPYTLDTTDDLSLVYPDGYFSPIQNEILSTPGNPRSDPFWIVYSHPNTRGMESIPEGTTFGDVVIDDFFHMPGEYPGHSCS